MIPARRLRGTTLAAIVVLAGGLFLAWSQPWFRFGLATGELEVRGDVAAGALPALAIVSLALVLALVLAGPGFRVVLGILEALIGMAAVAVCALAIGDPVGVSSPALVKALGISGHRIVDVVSTFHATAWPVVGLVVAALTIPLGTLIAVTAGRWPATGRRFSRTRTAPEGVSATDADPVQEWDALSDGDDPTRPNP
jgi:uncharacterized membrane protein (TIGR02234 family)